MSILIINGLDYKWLYFDYNFDHGISKMLYIGYDMKSMNMII